MQNTGHAQYLGIYECSLWGLFRIIKNLICINN